VPNVHSAGISRPGAWGSRFSTWTTDWRSANRVSSRKTLVALATDRSRAKMPTRAGSRGPLSARIPAHPRAASRRQQAAHGRDGRRVGRALQRLKPARASKGKAVRGQPAGRLMAVAGSPSSAAGPPPERTASPPGARRIPPPSDPARSGSAAMAFTSTRRSRRSPPTRARGHCVRSGTTRRRRRATDQRIPVELAEGLILVRGPVPSRRVLAHLPRGSRRSGAGREGPSLDLAGLVEVVDQTKAWRWVRPTVSSPWLRMTWRICPRILDHGRALVDVLDEL